MESNPYNYSPSRSYVSSDRPIGVTIIVILNFLGIGILSILLLLAWFIPGARQEVHVLLQFLLVGVIGVSLVISVGLWRLREWSRQLSVFLYGLSLFIDIISSFATTLTGDDLVSFAISVGIIFYLTRPNVREHFD